MHREGVVGVSKRVLVLLDDPELGAVIGLHLAVDGQVVDIARSADRARALVDRHEYGVVLVDMRLCESTEVLEGGGPVFQVIAPDPPDPEKPARFPPSRSARQQILASLDAILHPDGPAGARPRMRAALVRALRDTDPNQASFS